MISCFVLVELGVFARTR